MLTGYIPPRRTKEIEGTFEAAEGAEPFRATIIKPPTFADIDDIPMSGVWSDIFAAIAPYVIGWNAMGRNSETGEYETLPPPAEAGPDVFRLVPPEASAFLLTKIKTAHLGDGDERLKASGPSDDMPAGRPETTSDSTSTTTKTKRPKSRRGTT